MPRRIDTQAVIDSVRLEEQASTPSTPASGYGAVFGKTDGKVYYINDSGIVTDLTGGQGARVYHNVDQTIGNNSITTMAFNSEYYDNDAIHDTVTNNGRLTCKTAGKYLIFGQVGWAANANFTRALYIQLNAGATSIAIRYEDAASAAGGSPLRTSVMTVYDLAVNDYVVLGAYQNSGGSLNVVYSADWSPVFGMQRIG